MMTLEKAAIEYYHGNIEKFQYTSPVSGYVTVSNDDGRFRQCVYMQDDKIIFGSLEVLKTMGRPKKCDKNLIQKLKGKGFTQEQIAFKTRLSVSTVKRNWN